MQEHQTNKATLQTFQPTYPYYRRPFSLTTIIWVPLGRLAPLGRFGASWNIPLTVGDILYTPAGRIMRDERSLVTLLLGTYCTPLLRDIWEMRDYRRFIHPCFSNILTSWRQCVEFCTALMGTFYYTPSCMSGLAVASFYRRLIHTEIFPSAKRSR